MLCESVSIGKISGHHDNVLKWTGVVLRDHGSHTHNECGRSWGQKPWPHLKGQCWLASSSSSHPSAPAQNSSWRSFTAALPRCDPVLDPPDCAGLWGHRGGQRLWQLTSFMYQGMIDRDALESHTKCHPARPLPSTASSPFTWFLERNVVAFAEKRTKWKVRERGSE